MKLLEKSSFCYNGNMLEIFCAIYPEAKILIRNLKLKKEHTNLKWDRFINEEKTVRLTLTGVGKTNAISAITTTLLDSKEPFVMSFGSAAYLKEMSFDLYQASCICDIDTGIAYYPDLIFDFECKECGFLTGSQLLSTKENSRMTIDPCINLKTYLDMISKEYSVYQLYDTESSAIYEACNTFVGPHEMLFLRFPSDCDASSITSDEITSKVELLYPKIESIITKILSSQTNNEEFIDKCVDSFKQHIHASKNICDQIDQFIRYCETIHIDYKKIIQELLETEIRDKDDGKKVFYEFQKKCYEA